MNISLKKTFAALTIGSALNAPGTGGETFVTRAVKMGLPGVVKDFLNLGADPDHKNAAGESPLYIALDLKDRAMIRTLLEGGASVFLEKNGMTFREHALKAGMPDVAGLAQALEEERYSMAVAMSMGRGF